MSSYKQPGIETISRNMISLEHEHVNGHSPVRAFSIKSLGHVNVHLWYSYQLYTVYSENNCL